MTVDGQPGAQSIPRQATTVFWSDTKQRVMQGRVTPFISNYMSAALFGMPRGALATRWAKQIHSPFSEFDNREMARVAQYYAVTREGGPFEAKQAWLSMLTESLLDIVSKDEHVDAEAVQESRAGFDAETGVYAKPFSEIASDLGYPRFERPEANPFRLLAEMPLPLYITTSHHQFLEYALIQTQHKEPVSEIFYWGDHLDSIPSVFEEEPDWEPSVQRPLVYHLYGLDRYPESIVLTEDDHLDLLDRLVELRSQVKLAETTTHGAMLKGRDLPAIVRKALSSNALLTLGYSVITWEFRVLFRGLILPYGESRRSKTAPKGVCMQIKPGELDALEGDSEGIMNYLEQYFKGVFFRVYWGSVESCVHELYDLWRR